MLFHGVPPIDPDASKQKIKCKGSCQITF